MICFSFDTDHMNEARMIEFLETVQMPGLGTFFCTQFYECLAKTENELAPHPYLGTEVDWTKELHFKREEFPKAKGWRSHSCVYSHMLAVWLAENNYQYVSIHDDFGRAGVQPVKHAWGIWHLPIYYMDTLDFSRKKFWKDDKTKPFSPDLIECALQDNGVYVFDFHPIHLLLNTPESDYYFSVRDRFLQGDTLQSLRYQGYGVANFFKELCDAMLSKNQKSLTLQDALQKFINIL